MKRFTYAMVMAVALIVMVSSFAVAGDGECAKKAEAKTASAECTTAEKAACADAKMANAECATPCGDKAAYKAASADMHECCATAVAAGEGCCGKEAEVLKASYEEKVAYHQAAITVKADMHKCCATALEAGNGCCGHSADEMKADYDKKVQAQSKKVATSEEKASDDS
jgi:hypothetical protein